MIYVGFLGAAVVLSIALRRAPVAGLGIVLALAVGLPLAVQGQVAPGPHPAAQFALIYGLVYAASSQATPEGRFRLLPAPVLALILFLYPFLDLANGTSVDQVVGAVVNFVVAPIVVIVIGRSAAVRDPGFARKLGLTFLAIAVAVATLAICQYFVSGLIPFLAERRRSYWWFSETTTRSPGTLGSPLDLATFAVVAIPMARFVKRTPVRLGALLALVGGVVVAQSRAQVVIAIIAALIVLASDRRGLLIGGLIALVTVPYLVAVATQSGLFSGLQARFDNDYNSADYRALAYQWLLEHGGTFFFTGFSGPRSLRESGILGTSLENAYATVALNYSLVFAILLMLYQMWVAFSGRPGRERTTVSVTALLAVIAFNSYSGFAFETGMMMILAVALSLSPPRRLPAQNVDATPSPLFAARVG